MIHEKACPICGHASFFSRGHFVDHMVSKEIFEIQECENCRVLFTSPRPKDEDLGKYYESNEYLSHTDSSRTFFEKVYRLIKNIALQKKERLIRKFSPTGANLVDYGCGTGEFLSTCREKGWVVKGFEPSQKAAEIARLKNEVPVEDPSVFVDLQDRSLDVITLWHVLEHLPDPVEKMEMFHMKLRDQGKLIIAVPNHESYDAQVYGKDWAAWDVPIHLFHFSKSSMNFLAEKSGFKVSQVINMPFDSFYVSLLSEEYLHGNKRWISALWTGLRSNLKGFGHKNASSLIYVLEKQ